MLIMERRKDGTTGHHEYLDDNDQYDIFGYNRAGRYWRKYDRSPRMLNPWVTQPPEHPGHLRTSEDEADPAKYTAHVLTVAERQANRAVDAYESEMQEKYPDGNYLPFTERPIGIQTRYTKFAERMDNRKPGEAIETTRTGETPE